MESSTGCRVCNVNFSNTDALHRHMANEHPEPVRVDEIIAAVASISGTSLPEAIIIEDTQVEERQSNFTSQRSRAKQRHNSKSRAKKMSAVSVARVVADQAVPLGIKRKHTAPSKVFNPKMKPPTLSVVPPAGSSVGPKPVEREPAVATAGVASIEEVAGTSSGTTTTPASNYLITPHQVAIAAAELSDKSAEEITSRIGQQVGIPSEQLGSMLYTVSTVVMREKELASEIYRLVATSDDATLRARMVRLAARLNSHPVVRFFQ